MKIQFESEISRVIFKKVHNLLFTEFFSERRLTRQLWVVPSPYAQSIQHCLHPFVIRQSVPSPPFVHHPYAMQQFVHKPLFVHRWNATRPSALSQFVRHQHALTQCATRQHVRNQHASARNRCVWHQILRELKASKYIKTFSSRVAVFFNFVLKKKANFFLLLYLYFRLHDLNEGRLLTISTFVACCVSSIMTAVILIFIADRQRLIANRVRYLRNVVKDQFQLTD